MSKPTKSLEELIKGLPPELEPEVRQFVESLLARRRRKKHGSRLRQDWAEALKEYRDQYTALELQRKSLEWRGD